MSVVIGVKNKNKGGAKKGTSTTKTTKATKGKKVDAE